MPTIFKLFFIVSVLILVPVSSKAKIISVEVEGSGATQQDAINNALKEALRQVTGVTIDASDMSSIFSHDASVSKESSTDGSISRNSNSIVKNTKSDTMSQTKGYISSYQITNSERQENLEYVQLLVNIDKYEAPGVSTDSKRNLTISKFSMGGAFSCSGSKINTENIIKDLNQTLVEEFTNSRRFNILDRDNMDVYQEEKNLILSKDAALKEKSRLGNIIGADYLVTGNIKNFSITRSVEHLDITGEDIETKSASAIIDYRIILASNMQIKKTDTIKIALGNKDLANKPFNCVSIGYDMLKETAKKIVDKSIEAIYPAMVIKVSGNKVYMNQAEGTVKIGDLWNIFSLGETLIDPYSGEKLGEEETLVATVKVSEIKPKFSIGTVVEGDIKLVAEKQICRRTASNKSTTASSRKTKEPKTEVFKLPFDK